MSDTQPPLPEDIVEYLDRIHTMNWYTADIINEAKSLHAKYAPKRETLADHGIVTWERVFRFNRDTPHWRWDSKPSSDPVQHETDNRVGVSDRNNVPVPWPEIEGINPADLLSDGWQIRNASDLPDGWKIAAYGGDDCYTSPSIAVEAALVVFCRPPQGNET